MRKPPLSQKPESERIIKSSLRIIIPLYVIYLIFALSIFLVFLPLLKRHMLDQKKAMIHELTESAWSLLSEYDQRSGTGEFTLEEAQKRAANRIRGLRYGPEGKDYFWILDMHANVIMHPYVTALEGQNQSQFVDSKGKHVFAEFVRTVERDGSGYVEYMWQWKDNPDLIVPKLSYVKGFSAWGWIIGTGLYVDDIEKEIKEIAGEFSLIFFLVLLVIILISFYITRQTIRIEKKRSIAEKRRNFEELRLKKLLELSRMSEATQDDLMEFALEEAILLTESDIGYIAFLSEDETVLTMHTWSRHTMKQCEIEDKTLIYHVSDTGLWAEAVRKRDTVVINHYEKLDAEAKKGYPEGHVRILRLMNIPIFENDRIAAVAGVGNKAEPYDESDVRQLKLMMDGMWNIIQKKRSEDELKKSEVRFRTLFENAPYAIVINDFKTGAYLEANQAFLAGDGLEKKDLIGVTPDQVYSLPPGELEDFSRRLKTDGFVYNHESRVVKPGASERYVVISSVLLELDTSPQILSMVIDVTDRKKAEAALLISENRYRSLFMKGVLPLIELSEKEEILQVNEEFIKIMGYSADEVNDADELWRMLLPDGEESAPLPPWKKEAKEGETKTNEINIEEYALSCRDGSSRMFIIRSRKIADRFLVSFFETTEYRRLETGLRQAQKMEALGTLAGGIAHDFNNILSSVFGFTELARLAAKGSDKLTGHLDQIMAAGLRARDLVRHILTFSRRADVEKHVIHITPLIKETLKFLRASIPVDIDIRHQFDHSEGLILADPTQVHQVLMNLFTNAVHSMKGKGGVLTVRLESVFVQENGALQIKELKPGQYQRLTVMDTGCGIPKEIQGRIFEPFFTTKIRGEGTGMGLSTVYGIVRDMDGAISVYSEPGMGTSFVVMLPEVSGSARPEPVSGVLASFPGKGRLLVVDDEAAIVEWTRELLIKIGYAVTAVTDSREALEIFRAAPDDFDLLLTDMAMPYMNGLELAGRVREIRPDQAIILCTGFSGGVSSEAMNRSGIVDIIMKPMIAGELAKAVDQVLKASGKG